VKRRYLTVDVFTDRLFAGNPLAVVLDAHGLSTTQMREIAIEFNYSETAFVLAPKQPEHTAWVRIFTPYSEIPFAGHPNVGTAFALAGDMADRNERLPEQFVFEEEAGLVPVSLLREDGAVMGAELLAPEPLSRRGLVAPDRAAACLSLSAEDIRVDEQPPQVLSVGLPFLVVELASRDALRRAAPNRSAFDHSCRSTRRVLSMLISERPRRPGRTSSPGCSRNARQKTRRRGAPPARRRKCWLSLPEFPTARRFCVSCRASIWAGRACLLRVFSNEPAA
jgi:trans-2,3-dihydro-3-hydroxyanthranilate isomerase